MCTVFGIKYIVGAQWTVIIIWVNVKLESFEKNLKKNITFEMTVHKIYCV